MNPVVDHVAQLSDAALAALVEQAIGESQLFGAIHIIAYNPRTFKLKSK